MSLNKKLLEYLKNPENKKKIDAYFDSIKRNNEVDQRYIDKFHNMLLDKQIILVNNIISKYESKSYKDKEYKHGRMPMNILYNLLYDYCQNYAEKTFEDEDCPFENEHYIFCNGNFELRIMYGQGTEIDVRKLK